MRDAECAVHSARLPQGAIREVLQEKTWLPDKDPDRRHAEYLSTY